MSDTSTTFRQQQIAYYQARASEYDEWFLRQGRYDVVVFSFWLSHVPHEHFPTFWQVVAQALRPEGRVFFLDSLRSESSTATNQSWSTTQNVMQRRRLNDGREFEIVKIYYQPDVLAAQLRALGWQITVSATPHYFLYGTGSRA